MLADVQRNLWEAYQRAESRAPRAEKLIALEAFLDALLASPNTAWFPWARSIAEQVVDQGLDFIIRQPLFERAVFPALAAGYREGLSGCARWLTGLAQQLRHSPACLQHLKPQEATELALLRSAIRHDPADLQSRLRLIERIAERLRYSLHELPTGVLFGMDGATPEQCVELEEELNEFCGLVLEEGMEPRFAELIQACRLHFPAYRDYLLNRERHGTYAEYLSQTRTNVGNQTPG